MMNQIGKHFPASCALMIILLGLLLSLLPAPGMTQDNPFEDAGTDGDNTESVESPFQTDEEGDIDNPFGTEPDSGTVENPFGETTSESTETTNPFADESTNPTNPFQGEQNPNSPFSDGESTETTSENPFNFEGSASDSRQGSSTVTKNVTPAAQVRGVYVHSGYEGMQSVGQIVQLSQDIQAATFNRVYVETRTVRGTSYQSEYEQSLPYVTPGFPNPIRELKGRTSSFTEIVAVVSLLPAYNATVGNTPPPNNVLYKNPDYVNKNVDGDIVASDNQIYMDPGNAEIVDYLRKVILEIEAEIAPDAYLFTGVRYPGQNWGYSDAAVSAFRSQVGGEGFPPPSDPVWGAWRRNRVTDILRSAKSIVQSSRPRVPISVLIETEGPPVSNWSDWQNSPTYRLYMQDWITWCKEGVVDEIVFEVHERVSASSRNFGLWVDFINNNTYNTGAILSIAGNLNFASGLTNQYRAARSRGVGTILFHYADPLRSSSRGFYQSLPTLVFETPTGRPVPGRPLTGTPEWRIFEKMNSPPPQIFPYSASPTPSAPLADGALKFSTPTPIPTATPEPKYKPTEIPRTIVLTSGQQVEAVVLEITPKSITIRPEGMAPMVMSRSMVKSINPPL